MIAFFANLFGYVLNFLYKFVGNFGFAIILFSILVKLIMLPISIKQQKTLKKNQKINDEMKQIQFKYKNDPEKLNQEIMALYKRENMNPFSGCFSAIAQIILLFAVFYLVRSPLTYMKKIDKGVIENLEMIVQEKGSTSNYREIEVVNYINNLKNAGSTTDTETTTNEQPENNNQDEQEVNKDEQNNIQESESNNNSESTENQKEEFKVEDHIDEAYINMDFLGINLSNVPTEDITNVKALVIPFLYVISSFISIKMSTNVTKKEKNLIGDGKEGPEDNALDAMEEANKRMSLFMPIMSISIALIAPLGLALYWLVNNILMMIERVVLNKILKDKEEEAIKNA